jgi:hypothetical protein
MEPAGTYSNEYAEQSVLEIVSVELDVTQCRAAQVALNL